MKISRYLVLLIAVLTCSAFLCRGQTSASEAAPAAAPAETPAAEKKLTPDEIELQKRLEEMDKEAVETARNIRRQLRSVLEYVHGISPDAAKFLMEKYFGVRLIQYAAAFSTILAVFIIVRYVMGFSFTRLEKLFSRSDRTIFAKAFVTALRRPVGMLVWVVGLYFALAFILRDSGTVAVTSRAVGILFWIACFWVIAIVCDAFFEGLREKLRARSASATANLIEFLRRVFKSIIVIIALLSILTNCGINVNTIIASLGIGGMALAFASQDTIANFFGSVSIIIDRPFIVGDWVKTSECEGNVEAIGFRSTRIRTFSKTLVSIPNSALAKESVENFSKMPVRRVTQTLGVTYSTTAEQMEKLLADLREAVLEVEGVDRASGVLAEFVEFGPSSLDISLIYYTKRIDLAYFNATKRRANLVIMRIVDKNGLSFAFPSTSVYIESGAEKA